MQISSLRTSRIFFVLTVSLAAAFGFFLLILRIRGLDFFDLVPSQLIHTEVGLYCPGCGGTRSFFATLRGDIRAALWFHPAVPIALLALGIFWLSHILNLVSRGRIRPILLKPIYFYVLIALVLLQWVAKYLHMWITGVKPI